MKDYDQNNCNADQDEIQKFDQMAESWWDLEGPMRMLHKINPIRLNFISQHSQLQNASALDIGCGAGILSEALARAGANVTAIDLSPAALSAAKEHANQENLSIDYQQSSCEELAANEPGKYQIITCMEMLEHVPDPAQILQSIQTLLAPNGVVFLSTINRTALGYLNAILGAEYILRLLPIGTHHFNRFIKPAELACWCREADLSFKGLTGVSYNPLTDELKTSKNTQVNYMAYATRVSE